MSHIFQPNQSSPPLPKESILHHIFPETRSPPASASASASAPADPSSIAAIDGLSGRSLSRKDLVDQALCLAGGLQGMGLKRGDVVGLIAMNSLEWLNAMFGSLAAGLRVSPINYAYTPPEILHQLSHSGVSLVFVGPNLLNTLHATIKLGKSKGWSIPDDRIILVCTKTEKPKELSGFKCIEEIRGKKVIAESFDGKNSEETALMCYSSGTTGLAKGVESSHWNMTSQLVATNICYQPLTPQKDVILGFLPFSHMYGLALLVLHPFTIGVPLVILPRFEEISVLSAIQKYKITWSLVVPPILIVLAQSKIIDKYDLRSWMGAMSAAAPLSGELCEAFQKRVPGCVITQAYGLTETSPLITMMTTLEAPGRQGKIGRLMPTFQARLVDVDTGKDISTPNTPGELWVKGPSVMKGYYKNPDATKGTFDGLWFKTGDSAVVDEMGYFAIADRLKELIKYKGFQVPPAELEATLLTHPKVADVAVIGIYAPHLATELPRAYIVPKGGLDSLKSQKDKDKFSAEVVEWMKERVANHKRLRGGVVLIDIVPKSPTGKILRKNLRAKAKEDEEKEKKRSTKAKL